MEMKQSEEAVLFARRSVCIVRRLSRSDGGHKFRVTVPSEGAAVEAVRSIKVSVCIIWSFRDALH